MNYQETSSAPVQVTACLDTTDTTETSILDDAYGYIYIIQMPDYYGKVMTTCCSRHIYVMFWSNEYIWCIRFIFRKYIFGAYSLTNNAITTSIDKQTTDWVTIALC